MSLPDPEVRRPPSAAAKVGGETRLPGTHPRATECLLEVRGLRVEFLSDGVWVPAVEDVSFSLAAGETMALVGESGCGKTVSSLAVMGLIPRANGRVRGGSIDFDGRDLRTISSEELRRVRGDRIAMIFQEPMTSLNPAFTIGQQISFAVRAHRSCSKAEARAKALGVLDRVGIPDAARRIDDYPHTFSGGMRQRAMIAMALSCEPELLIADEPTTALDVTVQAQIIELLRSLRDETGMAMLFVTHDLGVVADIGHRVVVMYAGQVVETASVAELFRQPRHPYTEGLLRSTPQLGTPGQPLPIIPGVVPRPGSVGPGCRFRSRCGYAVAACAEDPVELVEVGGSGATRCIRHDELHLTPAQPPTDGVGTVVARRSPLLEVRGLRKEFPVTSGVLRRVRGHVRAVDGVDLTVGVGETLGVVGESGSGKSTIARLVLRLIEPTSGTVRVDGTDIARLGGAKLRQARAHMQMVFQDPYSSLDPRATIGASIGEPLEIHRGLRGAERNERVAELLELVGIGPHLIRRYPHEFSGGQRQRIAIARALALEPRLLVCDEPVSALDTSTQSQVINLFADLQERLGLAYLFIAHDLSVVRHLSHRIAVTYLGRVVEEGAAEEVCERPTHPYTEALLSAIPVPDPQRQRQRRRIVLRGEMPSALAPPSGCRFRTRCPYAMDVCASEDPPPFTNPAGTTTWCHLHRQGPRINGASVITLGRGRS